MRTNTPTLAALQAELDRLKDQIAQVGFVCPGSVVRRYMPCGKPGCRCQADPPTLHGPYWQYSHKVAGKTITRRLTQDQARLYQHCQTMPSHSCQPMVKQPYRQQVALDTP